MRIERSGAERFHGVTYTDLQMSAADVRWNEQQKCVETKAYGGDFSTSSMHNYRVQIPVPEFRLLLDALCSAAAAPSGSSIVAALAPSLASLLLLSTEIARANSVESQRAT